MRLDNPKVYYCSSIGLDYFFFLGRTLGNAGFKATPIYLVSEKVYRKRARYRIYHPMKIWLRIQMYLIYPLFLWMNALFSIRPRTYIVTSNTFFAPLIPKLTFTNHKVVHLLYDLFPDAIQVAGMSSDQSMTSRIGGKIQTRIQRDCDATVYLGQYLKKHAESRWGVPRKSVVIDISTDISGFSSEQPISPPDRVVVHYGGQLGYLHDSLSIIEIIKSVKSGDLKDKIDFNFYVSGAQALFIEEELKGIDVKIIPAVSSDVWRNDIRSFHIGLVTLTPGGATVCLPSKTYGMMAGGLAILGICPEWSDLAGLVRKCHGGWIINNSPFIEMNLRAEDYLEKVNQLRPVDEIVKDANQIFSKILRNRTELLDKKMQAFNGVRDDYDIDSLANKWRELINSL